MIGLTLYLSSISEPVSYTHLDVYKRQGPKTVQQIFAICPGLEAIRDHFPRLPPKFQKKLQDHLEDIRKLFYDCRGNCSAMLRFVEDAISVEPPSLRTLQKFCTPFRLELQMCIRDRCSGVSFRPRMDQSGSRFHH